MRRKAWLRFYGSELTAGWTMGAIEETSVQVGQTRRSWILPDDDVSHPSRAKRGRRYDSNSAPLPVWKQQAKAETLTRRTHELSRSSSRVRILKFEETDNLRTTSTPRRPHESRQSESTVPQGIAEHLRHSSIAMSSVNVEVALTLIRPRSVWCAAAALMFVLHANSVLSSEASVRMDNGRWRGGTPGVEVATRY